MKAAAPDKWIEGVSPSDQTLEVASRTLAGRLRAVLSYLPPAAKKADEDDRYIHQLRIWTRRSTTALRLYGDLLPRKRRAWLERRLGRVRRAANDARDCDVLIERLTKKPAGRWGKRWLEATVAERAEAQKGVVAVHDALWRDGRFPRRVAAFLKRVRARSKAWDATEIDRFGDWAGERLRPIIERFFAAAPDARTNEAALHQFRIRGKELRYAMEITAGAFPEAFRTRLYPALAALQDRLGKINDVATSKARLLSMIERENDPAAAAAWGRMLAREQHALDQARHDFDLWCTEPMLQVLRDDFDEMLADPGGRDTLEEVLDSRAERPT